MKTLQMVIIFLTCRDYVLGYFTLPGGCPENVELKEDFNLASFEGPWYQAYHYSSDGQTLNNCSTVEVKSTPRGIYLNTSRVDRGLFHRYSIGKLEHNKHSKLDTDHARLLVKFQFDNAPRRLRERKYTLYVLGTNYKYFATVYTCQYSPLINKHYVYLWILSRHPTLNEVSKELAVTQLTKIGVDPNELVKDSWTDCAPKYYEDEETEPPTFRYAVPI